MNIMLAMKGSFCSNARAMNEEILTLNILDVVYRGRGLARHDGLVVFVPHVLPEETVTARITKKRKSYAEAELVSVEKESPLRINPACPLSKKCQGCVYQHIGYEEEIRLKDSQFKDMLQRQAGIDPDVHLPPVPSPSPLGYRNKIVLHAHVSEKDGSIALGYFSENNKTIFDVPCCPLAADPINELLKEKRQDKTFMSRLKENSSATFRYTQKDGAVCWIDNNDPGTRKLTETTPIGELKVHRKSFFQVNSYVGGRIVESVQEILRRIQPKTVIDLFCGVGILSLAAGKAGVRSVLGIDSDRSAIRSAIQNSKSMEMRQVEFLTESATNGFTMGLEPISPKNCTVILDPPRRGLEVELIEAIGKKPPSKLIYISCAADMLARDISRLKKFGYNVKQTQIFDMFARTPYFESVTVLVKKSTE